MTTRELWNSFANLLILNVKLQFYDAYIDIYIEISLYCLNIYLSGVGSELLILFPLFLFIQLAKETPGLAL